MCFLAHQLILPAQHPHKMRYYYSLVLPTRKLRHQMTGLFDLRQELAWGFLFCFKIPWAAFKPGGSKQVNLLDPRGGGSIQAMSSQKVRVQDRWTARAGPAQRRGGSHSWGGRSWAQVVVGIPGPESSPWAPLLWHVRNLWQPGLITQSLLATGLRELCTGQSSEQGCPEQPLQFPAHPVLSPALENVYLKLCAPDAVQSAGVCKKVTQLLLLFLKHWQVSDDIFISDTDQVSWGKVLAPFYTKEKSR